MYYFLLQTAAAIVKNLSCFFQKQLLPQPTLIDIDIGDDLGAFSGALMEAEFLEPIISSGIY